ncbi:hypothetical protein VTO73DRAFT_13591 [Trametes versicolor]
MGHPNVSPSPLEYLWTCSQFIIIFPDAALTTRPSYHLHFHDFSCTIFTRGLGSGHIPVVRPRNRISLRNSQNEP